MLYRGTNASQKRRQQEQTEEGVVQRGMILLSKVRFLWMLACQMDKEDKPKHCKLPR